MADPLVSVLIPAWNLWPMTRECLESLAAHTPPDLIEVCVADNGSTDATATDLTPLGRKLFGDWFSRVRFPDNRGFAAACNAAARQARGEFLFFLNNDTLALPGWLPPLLEVWRQPEERLGAVGPLLLYEGGERVQHCGVAFSYGGVQHLYASFPADHPAISGRASAARRFQALTAAALCLPRRLFLELGLFHEGYRNGFEDLDLCRSLTRAGYALRCVAESRLIHRESLTPGRKKHERENAALYAARWPQPPARDLYDFAGRDGFAVRLTDSLETCVCLPPRQETELNRLATRADAPEAVWAMLKAHPVWLGGYERLGALLSGAGRHDDAVYVQALACQFFPSLAAARGLEKAALRAGNAALAARAREDCLRQAAMLADMEPLRRKAAVLGRQARRDGRPDVEALYLDWLRRHGG